MSGVTGLHPDRKDSPAREFLVRLHAALKKRTDERPVSRSRQPLVTSWLNAKWAEFERSFPGPWMLAPGCRAAGLAGRLDKGALYLSWRTVPATRLYPAPSGETVYLGTFRATVSTWAGKNAAAYDLCVRFESPVSPVLTALFSPERREEWKLGNHGYGPKGEHAAALNEAHKRAILVNALSGTQWARPGPLGAIAAPYLEAKAHGPATP